MSFWPWAACVLVTEAASKPCPVDPQNSRWSSVVMLQGCWGLSGSRWRSAHQQWSVGRHDQKDHAGFIMDTCQHENTECAAEILSYTLSPAKDVNLSEAQKVASLRMKGHFERPRNSRRAGLEMMRCSTRGWFGIKLRAAEETRKNLQGYGTMWFSPLHNASKALYGLALPSTASFFFFSLTQILYSSQAETFSLDRAWHRFSFNCSILYVIPPFNMLFYPPLSHPLPLLFIQLTSSEHQEFASFGDSAVKCVSQQFSLQVHGKNRVIRWGAYESLWRLGMGRVGGTSIGRGTWRKPSKGNNASMCLKTNE